MKTNHQSNGAVAKRITVKGKRMVMVDEAEFDRLLVKADEWEPTKPAPDADGNYPASETISVSIAIDIIRDRRRLGLTQAELARLAGIRLATLNRIERGDVRSTSVRTIEKIDRALQAAEGKAAEAANGKAAKPGKNK
jgi:DNA-binding XRE family transcriptional regulator